jgi:transketolase
VALVLTRQALPTLDPSVYAPATGIARGAYVLAGRRAAGAAALAAHEQLRSEGIHSRVVSMPCWELFEEQPQEYRDEVLPPAVTARVAVQQVPVPLKSLLTKFGFIPEAVASLARQQVEAGA